MSFWIMMGGVQAELYRDVGTFCSLRRTLHHRTMENPLRVLYVV